MGQNAPRKKKKKKIDSRKNYLLGPEKITFLVLIKTRKPDTNSFRRFSKNLEDITINGSLADSP